MVRCGQVARTNNLLIACKELIRTSVWIKGGAISGLKSRSG